jgi:hypothetical protein
VAGFDVESSNSQLLLPLNHWKCEVPPPTHLNPTHHIPHLPCLSPTGQGPEVWDSPPPWGAQAPPRYARVIPSTSIVRSTFSHYGSCNFCERESTRPKKPIMSGEFVRGWSPPGSSNHQEQGQGVGEKANRDGTGSRRKSRSWAESSSEAGILAAIDGIWLRPDFE